MVNGGVSQPLGISENTDTLVRQQAYHPHEPLKQTNSMPHVHVHLFFQEAYTFWICSTHLPMWLLNSDNKNSVKVEACQSTCLTVEKQCPFLIKGTEDDMASGNPSFMCKGKTHSKNSSNWCMIQNIAVCASGAQRAKFAKKVHKPPLWVNIINFELNWFNASIWVPCNPSDPKKSWCCIQIYEKQVASLHIF